MKEKIKQKGVIQIPLLIGIIVSIIIASGLGYGFFEYNKVSNLVEEASQLIKGESFVEANSKLELANNKVIVGVLGIKKKEIKNMMNNNEKLSEDKSNYNQGIEEFNNENWEQAEEFLLKISEISPYYQAAKNKIEDVQNNIIQEIIAQTIEEIKKEEVERAMIGAEQAKLEEQKRLQQEILEEGQRKQEEVRLRKIEECKDEADAFARVAASSAGKKASDEIWAQYEAPSGENQTFTEQLNSLNFGLGFTQQIAESVYKDTYSREYSRVYLIYYNNCLNNNY